MKTKRIVWLTAIWLVMTQLSFSEQWVQDLNKGWTFHKVGSAKWYNAKVPGCVHTDLMDNKLIPDPFYRDNETKVQWVDKNSWEYKTDFTADEALMKMERIILDFKGLDTYADIFVNDRLLKSTDNMFCEWEVDIKPVLKSGENTLRILFHSPVAMGILSRDKFNLEAPNGYNLEFLNNDWPNVGPYMRKASYMFGWDWGPKLTTSGIWRPVYLKAWNTARINSLSIVQKEITAKKAKASAVFSIESSESMDATLNVDYSLNGSKISVKPVPVNLNKGINEVSVDIEIAKPAIWWPNGLGAHPVYSFTGSLKGQEKELDRISTKTGLRTVKLVQKPESDGGSTFYFEVNGVPVFAKGANYIPSDIFPSRVTDDHYREMLKLAADANMNMLRVWGGGIYESDLFYDLCDELGLMVWQDFAFAIYHMPDYKEFYESIQKELGDNITRLRNHPSIVLWCGNNETDLLWNVLFKRYFGIPYDEAEGKLLESLIPFLPAVDSINPVSKQRVLKEYDTVFYSIIPEAIQKYDYNARDYWPSSPMGGYRKPGTMTKPYSGDMHYYVAVINKPFSDYFEMQSHFFSEHGFHAWPDKKTVYEFTSVSDRSENSAVMKSHIKAANGSTLIRKYMDMYYKSPKNFDSYLYVSQLLQVHCMKMALELHRSRMPFTMGTLYWQLNDVWPVASWASLDFQNNPKALHYFVKKAFSPVIVVPSDYKGQFTVTGVSDKLQDINATLQMKIMDFSGKVLWSKESPVKLKANSSQVVYESKTTELIKNIDTTKAVFVAKLMQGKQVLAANEFYFSEPKDLSFTKADISRQVVETATGYTVTLTSTVLQKNVCLSSDEDIKFSDNYFDLLPGEKVTIQCTTSGKIENFNDKLKVISLVDTY
ncbi:MAG TPA: glycoside hydrolase family 2 protein [Bacteroidales bacterium]|nr:glycoside hydrolase family 2 protein [Bacteroidales bacterium]